MPIAFKHEVFYNVLRLQVLDRLYRLWSKCEQMTLPITVKWLSLFINMVEQRFCYVGTLTVIIFEMNDYVW